MINSDDDELFGAFPEWFTHENDCRSRTGNNMLSIMKLNVEQADRIENLLSKFGTLFSTGTRGFKQTHLTEYIIKTVGRSC